jgi:hypothetical protein
MMLADPISLQPIRLEAFCLPKGHRSMVSLYVG